jgi:hypothetical protein
MALLLIGFLALASFVLIGWLQVKADEKIRKDILDNSPRVDDAEYLSRLPFAAEGERADLALRLRGIFAGIGRLPRECIAVDMPLSDVFSAQCELMQDGIDWAELVMELEDGLGIEISEDASVPVDESYTVGAFSEKMIELIETNPQKPS